MREIAQRDLRNGISDVLRRAEAGERFVVTVGGRPVAELGPHERRRWVGRERLRELMNSPAPTELLDDLRKTGGALADPFDR
ncbi:MAG TPA: type II toxin-antitoxin system prevent-host-death family antitoxin [Thermoleophilaceae bacterium]|nr:type II toxin-antitoxin system prevent-host-death family antitoxin [Thermoleophilaceae bacterium]